MFTLSINADNAAFENLNEELARILHDCAERVQEGAYLAEGNILRDMNGNTVGSFQFIAEGGESYG